MILKTSLIVGNLSNEELRSLFKEIRTINRQDKPRYVKRGVALDNIFELDKDLTSNWYDLFIHIKTMIDSELLYRIEKDLI